MARNPERQRTPPLRPGEELERPVGEVWDDEDLELADPDQWDSDDPMYFPGNKEAAAVVPVRFPGEEFDALDEAAEQAGKPITEFIRELVKDGIAARQKKSTSKDDAA